MMNRCWKCRTRAFECRTHYRASSVYCFRVCLQLIVAVNAEQVGRLDNLYDRGIKNEVPDLKIVGPDEIRDIEPNCVVSESVALLLTVSWAWSVWKQGSYRSGKTGKGRGIWLIREHTHTQPFNGPLSDIFYQLLPCTVMYSILLIDQGKSGTAHCFLDMWQQLNEYLIFCQTLNSMWNVHGKKIKSVGTKSFEMIKSACRGKLCWCCKLLCAFSTEMCSGSGIDQGMLYDWLKLLCWDVHMHANHIICFHLAIQPFHVPLV